MSLFRRHPPLPVWMGFTFIGYMEWRRIRRRQNESASSSAPVSNPTPTPTEMDSFSTCTVSAYKVLPLRTFSRLWGQIHDVELPKWARKPLLGMYCDMFDCKMHEAVVDDLAEYKNLGELFRRRLKNNARPINGNPKTVVSPCDGKILHFGLVEGGNLEQIKGRNGAIAFTYSDSRCIYIFHLRYILPRGVAVGLFDS
jgi:phosphatidylserine decarboxylase